ncbi:MAG: hypothetical protein LIO65_10360, partial [Odoribacter sp.]|nr:hypothetical protein [Odoribacter sp.]
NTNTIESPNTGNKDVELEFSFSVSSVFNIQSRSYDDNSVRYIDVLVFDQDKKFIERIKVNNITSSGNIKKLKYAYKKVPTGEFSILLQTAVIHMKKTL